MAEAVLELMTPPVSGPSTPTRTQSAKSVIAPPGMADLLHDVSHQRSHSLNWDSKIYDNGNF